MIYTSKPLEGHGHHVEYCGGIDWCGEGQECYHNKEVLDMLPSYEYGQFLLLCFVNFLLF